MPTPRLITVAAGDVPTAARPIQSSDSAGRVAELLAAHDIPAASWSADHEPLRRALEALRLAGEFPLIFYWVGHGRFEHDHRRYRLALDGRPMTESEFDPAAILEAIQRRLDTLHASGDLDAWALVIMDTCGSAAGTARLEQDFPPDRPPDNLALVGTTAASRGVSFVGELPSALEHTLHSFTGNDVEGIPVREVVRQLRERLNLKRMPFETLSADARLPAQRTAPAGTMPRDTYLELAKVLQELPGDVRDHFLAKAQGATFGELAWHFTGREGEQRTIVDWLAEHDGGMLVVTGEPGAGKSALLGMVLTGSQPALVEAIRRAGFPISGPALNANIAFDAVLHVRNKTIGECFSELIADLGRPDAPDAGDPDAVLDWLRVSSTRTVILVDALDEARDPWAVATGFLNRLATIPACVLVVGTRRTLQHHVDQYREDAPSELLDSLAATDILDLKRDPAAAQQYLEKLLRRLPTHYHAEIGRIAAEIGSAEQPILFARLAGHELLAEPGLVLPAAADRLSAVLRAGHAGLFRRARERIGHADPVGAALLRALAYARGNGLPRRDGVWATAAAALDAGISIGEADIDRLLSAASPYIMIDSEHGQTVHRLAHQTFTETYLDEPGDAASAVFAGLLDHAMATSAESLNPYLVHHLAKHPVSGSDWQALGAAESLIDRLDPVALAAEITRSLFGRGDLPAALQVALVGLPHLAARPRPEQADLTRALVRSRLGLPEPERPVSRFGWAHLSRQVLHIPLRDDFQGVFIKKVEFGTLSERPVLIVSGYNGVSLWDPLDGSRIGEPWRFHLLQDCAVAPSVRGTSHVAAIKTHDQQQVVAVGVVDSAQTVRVTATAVVTSACAVAIGADADDVPTVAVGTEDGHVWLWRPATGAPVRLALPDGDGEVSGLALVRPSQRARLVVLYARRSVLVHDLANHSTIGPTEFGTGIWGFDVREAPDGEVEIVFANLDPTIRRVSVSGEEFSIEYLDRLADAEGLRCVTLGVSTSAPYLALGTFEGAIWLWGQPGDSFLGDPIPGHARGLQSLSFNRLGEDRLILASSGDSDDVVRLWDVSPPVVGGAGRVERLYAGALTLVDGVGSRSIAVIARPAAIEGYAIDTGELERSVAMDASTVSGFASLPADPVHGVPQMIVSVDWSGVVRVHRPDLSVEAVTTCPDSTLESVAAARLSSGQPVIAFGDRDGFVRLWRPGDEPPTRLPETHQGYARTALQIGADGVLLLADAGDRRCNVRLLSENLGHRLLCTADVSDLIALYGLVFARYSGCDVLVGMALIAVRIWELQALTQTLTSCLPDVVEEVRLVAVTAVPAREGEFRLITANAVGELRLWRHAAEGGWRIDLELSVAPSVACGLAVHDARLLVATNDGVICLEVPELVVPG